MGKAYLHHPNEDPPNPPRAQNKRYIIKVMFLAAVAHARNLSNGIWFDWKIRIWPIVYTKIAQHSSKHHPKGTKVLVPAILDGERYEKVMIEDAILAIKAHKHRPEGHTSFLQQDGAKSHTKGEIMEAIQEVAGDDNVLETQPANSSDLNVNDLGFFPSIQ
ncbi:unnamed protein product [Choristocarpus tenellus]